MNFEKKLEQLCEKNNLAINKFTPWHIQVKGVNIVNVYESKKTYYLSGSAKKGYFNPNNPQFIIDLATGECDKINPTLKVKRKKISLDKKR